MMNRSSKCNPKSSTILWISIITISLALLFVYVIHPITGTPFVKHTTYSGLSYFTPETYGKLEKGDLFVETFYNYDFAEQCEITNFYYVDNKDKDSFIYGKRPDVYVLTLDAGQHYEEIAEYIRSVGTPCGKEAGYDKYSYYFMSSSTVPSDRFVFRVGDTVNVLQFILVTEISDEDLVIHAEDGDFVSMRIILQTIHHWSSFE